MKNNLKLLGIIALVAAIGFSMTGCPTEAEPPEPTVTWVSINYTDVTIERGGVRYFFATVEGENNPPQTVIWSVEGNGQTGTTINQNGRLTVSPHETGTWLTVRARSTFNTTMAATATVYVFASDTDGPGSTIWWVSINYTDVTVERGGTWYFSATVGGDNNPPQTVTWSVEGHGQTGTYINENGRLTVSPYETAMTLTVRATSTFDPSMSASVDVLVPGDSPGGPGGPVMPAQLRNIDIIGAQALMVAPRGTVGRARNATGVAALNEGGNVLFKQVAGGDWIQVSMTDEEGNELQLAPPSRIMDLTDRWVVMHFEGRSYQWRVYCSCCGHSWWYDSLWVEARDYLVCKETGAVFDVSNIDIWAIQHFRPQPIANTYHGQPVVHADRNGNIYMVIPHTNGWRIARISTSATYGTATFITSDLFNVRQFAVDNSGNILFDVGTHFMARTAGGTLIPLHLHPNLVDRNGILFTGLNGNIYFLVNRTKLVSVYWWSEQRWCEEEMDWYFYRHYSYVYQRHLLAYKVEVRGATSASIIFTPVYIDGADEINEQIFRTCCCNRPNGMFHFPEKLVFFSSQWSGDAFYLSWPRNGTPRIVHNELGLNHSHVTSNDALAISSEEIFIRTEGGNYRLVAIDPRTGNTRDVIPTNTFARLLSHEVTSDGFVTIEAVTFGGNRNLVQVFPGPGGHIETLRVNLHEEETITLVRLR